MSQGSSFLRWNPCRPSASLQKANDLARQTIKFRLVLLPQSAVAGGTSLDTLRLPMKELITQGGPLIFLLLACSLLAVAIFLERFFHFHRSTVVVQDLLQGVGNLINRKNYVEALQI